MFNQLTPQLSINYALISYNLCNDMILVRTQRVAHCTSITTRQRNPRHLSGGQTANFGPRRAQSDFINTAVIFCSEKSAFVHPSSNLLFSSSRSELDVRERCSCLHPHSPYSYGIRYTTRACCCVLKAESPNIYRACGLREPPSYQTIYYIWLQAW